MALIGRLSAAPWLISTRVNGNDVRDGIKTFKSVGFNAVQC